VTPLEEARLWANRLVELIEDEIVRQRIISSAHAQGATWLGGRLNVHADRKLVSTREAAEVAGTSVDQVRQWASKGKLDRAGKVGREVYYHYDDVLALANRRPIG
jgi:hypothetical protein